MNVFNYRKATFNTIPNVDYYFTAITLCIPETIFAGIFGSVVKHSTADQAIASLIPPNSNYKITKRRYVLVLPRKNAPVYQCFTLGR